MLDVHLQNDWDVTPTGAPYGIDQDGTEVNSASVTCPAIEDVVMKVADENVIRFEHFSNEVRNFSARMPAGRVYAAQRMRIREEEHDGRGLIIAILLCMGCWAGLGYFLLS